MSAQEHSPLATWIGFSAVVMWGILPLLAKFVTTIPPFQLMGMTFAIAFIASAAKWKREGVSPYQRLQMPWRIWALGLYGFVGFHFFYFLAFRSAPAIEALMLINLWPLFTVFFAALLAHTPLHWWHGLGAICGFSGIILITTRGGDMSFSPEYLIGYLEAFCCAIIWSTFSVLSRRFASETPKDAVGAFCGAAAVLCFVAHLLLETPVTPSGFESFIIILMGLGPVGLAFFTWDYGIKYGNIAMLGILANGGLLIGTGLLITFGFAPFSPVILIAAMLVVTGAILGRLGHRALLRRSAV